MAKIKEIVFASKNKGKIREVSTILYPIPVLSLDDILFNREIIENGRTFQENSLIKAETVYTYYQGVVLADDSGLSVDALNGRPGVYSARYGKDDADRIDKLLSELKDVPDKRRTASFICSMTLVLPKDRIFNVIGRVNGKIINEARGLNGFGYDPIFVPDGFSLTMAELSPVEKNSISHRYRALVQIKGFLGI